MWKMARSLNGVISRRRVIISLSPSYGTKATPEFLQTMAYEVYVKNVTLGLLHCWLTDLGMTVSKNTLRNWLKKGKGYLNDLVKVLKDVAL